MGTIAKIDLENIANLQRKVPHMQKREFNQILKHIGLFLVQMKSKK
ncbi:conserved hypothetical protein [Aggregatibacter segnis ATCC 33393]|uniref:Uncharacterized protein n=1 Tax=Aggregatibacter segnis ATCC 33393 TaxID=888057 RepID=E6KXK5_9PAST|nr:conserved hypothetical protein [Aggregatibacter segnis ATCC 33393]